MTAGAAAIRRVALVCEVLHPPWDEGIRIVAARIALELKDRVACLALSERAGRLDDLEVHAALTNRWFVSGALKRRLRAFAPGVVLYVPWTSLTSRTLVRCRVLARYARAPVACLALQPRDAPPMGRLFAAAAAPDRVLACGPGTEDQARALGIPVARVPLGVDLDRFRPLPPDERRTLRSRARLHDEDFVVLHVGHLKEGRNVGMLEAIARLPGVRVMLVASTSTAADRRMGARLEAAGVMVMTHHEDRIETVYQCADAYVFPVRSRLDAIETPLSVLEAAACNLACVSTRFGGLPALLGETRPGVVWAEADDGFVEAVRTLAGRRIAPATREAVAGLTWRAAADRVLEAIGGTAAERAP